MRWRLFLPTLLIATAAACASPVVVGCPKPVNYSPEFQTMLADELDALDPDSALAQAMIDYHAEREQLRACRVE